MNEIKHNDRLNEAYENLRNGIIGQCCTDYIKALRAQAKNPNNVFAQARIEECERYFRSNAYAAICDIDGEYMIEQCMERAQVSNTIFKSRSV